MHTKSLLFVLLFTGFTSNVYSTSVLLNVNDIFTSNSDILKVEILSFTDSVMTCKDLNSNALLKVKCHTKSFRASTHPNSWEGTWPKVGEQLIMVTNFITSERVLFARSIAHNQYRFWDLRSIPFANTVFEIPRNCDFQPTPICASAPTKSETRQCSDGFLCSSIKLNALINRK